MRLTNMIPLRDGWKSASVLIRQIDQVPRSQSCTANALLINDDSKNGWEKADFEGGYVAVQSNRALRLHLNLRHQRAIATGLTNVFVTTRCDTILIMGADGVDIYAP